MLKKAASGVLALLPCSRTESTLRASKGLRPCWTDFFEHSLPQMRAGLPGASMGHGPEIFNRPLRVMAVEKLGTLRLLRRSGRTVSHSTDDRLSIPFLLNPEPVEGSKHERKSAHITAAPKVHADCICFYIEPHHISFCKHQE